MTLSDQLEPRAAKTPTQRMNYPNSPEAISGGGTNRISNLTAESTVRDA